MTTRSNLSMIVPPGDPLIAENPVQWALQQLRGVMTQQDMAHRNCRGVEEVPRGETCLVVTGPTSVIGQKILSAAGAAIPLAQEALGLVSGTLEGKRVLLVTGSDVRGMVYALLELADRLEHAAEPERELARLKTVIKQPANPIRSVTRLFVSEHEDKSWFYDKTFWQRYLSMLVSQRFNRFSLALGFGYSYPHKPADHIREGYLDFSYPFLLDVPGYDVRAEPLSDDEREQNLAMLRWISEQTAARGLHFQLGLWSQAYEWPDGSEATYRIVGLGPENHAAYCRDAVQMLLEECPAISGITFRAHYESGIPEGSHDFWRTVFSGVASCKRPVEIDIHGKGIDQELIETALGTGKPFTVSPKYWAEHMGLPYHQAAIRESERHTRAGEYRYAVAARRFMRYGFGDLLTDRRPYNILHRIWPGTNRLLLWGDPVMLASFGRHGHFCATQGVEICDPLTFKGRMNSGSPGGRETYADASLRPKGGDWEKYLYTYRLWGRLLYQPDTDPASWRRYLHHEFGRAAPSVEQALGYASRLLPLITTAHLPSASSNRYWPEIYTNMPIVDATKPHPYGDTPSPKRFGTVDPIDPALFSRIEDFAAELTRGERSGKYSPLDVAAWLDELAEQAASALEKAKTEVSDATSSAFRRLALDTTIHLQIGRFFAHKLRAGVAYALYRRTEQRALLDEAVVHYQHAREVWATLVAHTKGVYQDDLAFGAEPHLRGHWADRLAAIDDDLADMQREQKQASVAQAGALSLANIATTPLGEIQTRNIHLRHNPPLAFRPKEPLRIELVAPETAAQVKLHYRHLNQAEAYQVTPMRAEGRCFHATIPAAYTDSPYPLSYFFELHDKDGHAWLYPGFEPGLSNQPYFVIRHARPEATPG